ncbi:MAG: FAD-binding domain-containing protein [Archangium sp.]
MIPNVRVRSLNEAPIHARRSFVLYWMTSFRRARSNFALDRAIDHARGLGKPLIVLEPLRVGYPFASERIHAFVLQGMADTARAFEGSPVHHHPYVEEKAGDGKGLLEALAAKACVVVGDDWPAFFVPQMQRAAATKLDVRFEVVDSNGLYPLHHTTRVFTTAHSFRTHLQKTLPPHLHALPEREPLKNLDLPSAKFPSEISKRWPRASAEALRASPEFLASLPIDHSVRAVDFIGGSTTARERLDHFASKILRDYDTARSEPEVDGTSKLSPYLHFGHLSTHEVFERLKPAKWSPDQLGKSIGGAKAGWWKFSAAAEAFLDELVTWRELAFNMSSHRPTEFTSLSSLPSWALATIKTHAKDKRAHVYSLEEFERGETHDPLWNAAMGQLRTEGWFHNNVRMLWGKKIYEWSKSASDALLTMDTLMSRYSLDGRDPVSWSGALWVLGRYDRPWGPERPIFGKLRYMTSQNFARKVSVKQYVARYT